MMTLFVFLPLECWRLLIRRNQYLTLPISSASETEDVTAKALASYYSLFLLSFLLQWITTFLGKFFIYWSKIDWKICSIWANGQCDVGMRLIGTSQSPLGRSSTHEKSCHQYATSAVTSFSSLSRASLTLFGRASCNILKWAGNDISSDVL